MIDLKPFYQSYTRAAHLRWLKGDVEGAIEMMQAAVKAASPRDRESVAWAYSRLALYELQRGRLTEAERMADASLQYVPEYAASLLVRGRIQLARNRPVEAAVTLERAARLNPLPEYRWALADALRLLNRTDEAAAIEKQIVDEGAPIPARLPSTFPRDVRSGEKAVELPAVSWRTAPTSSRSMRWRGRWRPPGRSMKPRRSWTRALAEGTEDGRLFLHAAVIAAADGRPADAARWHTRRGRSASRCFPRSSGCSAWEP